MALRDELTALVWTDSDQSEWRNRLRASARDGADAEFAAFVSPGISSVNADALSDEGISRFNGNVDATLADLATERASQYEHPYTAAVLLDFAAIEKPTSKENRDATLAAANRYIDAVVHFSADPRQHVLAIGDAVARAVDLLTRYGQPVAEIDRLVGAVQLLVAKLSPTLDAEYLGAIATTLTRRLRRRTTTLNGLFDSLIAGIDAIGDPLKQARCADDLARLAALAGVLPRYKQWSAGVIGLAVLDRVGRVDALVSAGELMFALKLASESGHEIKERLLSALTDIKPPLKSAGASVPLIEFRFREEDVERSAKAMREFPNVEQRIIGCSQLSPIPTATERKQMARSLHPGFVASLVTFVVIGEHGPTADDPDTLAAHLAMETHILIRAQVLDAVLTRVDARTSFSGGDAADAFQTRGLIEPGQQPLFASAWDAWSRGASGLALFALFPFVEQVYRNACGRGLGRSRNGGVVVRVGDTLTTHVRTEFGEDVAAVYDHLLGREGAIRHGFAHGYEQDTPKLGLVASYCIFLLCLAYAHVYDRENPNHDRRTDTCELDA